MNSRTELLMQISNHIKNYRPRELSYDLDEGHVERWVSQFGKDVQDVVLQETNTLLSHCYFSKEKIKQFLFDVIECDELWETEDIFTEIQHTQFLDIQSKGSSQSHLLGLLGDLLEENYIVELSTKSTATTTRYVYLDDCLFSGNTLRRDLERWIDSAKDNSLLDIIFLATYSAGEYYIRNKILPELCDPKGIRYRIWALKRFNNNSRDLFNYDCLWSKETYDDNISTYIECLNEQAKTNGWQIRSFREKNYTSPLYTNDVFREIYEKAMLKAGAYIYSCCSHPKPSMRPMGYEFFNSFGFGAFFATYKNISNNCPLAFWWGDASAEDYHPFSKWYPLLPRKVNTNDDDDGFTWE